MIDLATNGSTPKPPKTDSALTILLKEMAASKVKVNETDKKAITNAFIKAMTERSKLQAALDAFDAKADDTAVKMVRCYGSKQVSVGGVRYIPTSRGARIYYKKMSDELEVEALEDTSEPEPVKGKR